MKSFIDSIQWILYSWICYLHSKHLQRNVKYEALWQMNLINGFRIVWPIRECGATIYVIENNGNSIPVGWKSKIWIEMKSIVH